MKRNILVIVLTSILISCNSSDKTTTITEESPETETIVDNESNTKDKQLKPIDTDEALIATALMAAPEESRANCKVIG